MHKKGTVVDEDIYLQLLPLWGSRLLAHYQCKSIPKRSEAATVQVKSVSPANKETVKTWQTSSGIALGFRPSITGYLEPQPRESSGWSDNMFPLSLSLSQHHDSSHVSRKHVAGILFCTTNLPPVSFHKQRVTTSQPGAL